jgi:hypothetical protein
MMFWLPLADGCDKCRFMPAKGGLSRVSGRVSGADWAAGGGKIGIVRGGGNWSLFLLS